MSDWDDGSGGSDERDDRDDHDRSYRSPRNVRELFERLGYDLTSRQDTRRLEANLQWAEQQRLRAVSWRQNRWRWVATVVGGIGAAVGKLLSDHWDGWFGRW